MIPLLYTLITSSATLVGGVLPMYTRLRLIEQRYLVAFAGGAMVAIALFDLIPEMETRNAAALLLGFFSIYLLEKLVMIHACREAECETHVMGWPALIGIAAESLIDGLAIAVGFQVAPALGQLIALAVFAPLGVLLSGLMPPSAFDPLIGFTAGVFLYVGASDLLPEAHRRFNLRVVMTTLAGGGLIPMLGGLLGR